MRYSVPTSSNDILRSVTITSVFENYPNFGFVEEGELETSDLVNVPNAHAIPLETIPDDTHLHIEDFSKKKMSDPFFKDRSREFYLRHVPSQAKALCNQKGRRFIPRK